MKNLKGAFNSFISILRLDEKAISNIAKDKTAYKYSFLFLIITLVISKILNTYRMPMAGLNSAVISIIYGIIYFIITISLLHIISIKLFNGAGSGIAIFNIAGLAYLINILSIIPYISIISAIWYYIILWKSLVVNYKLTKTKALFSILITLFILTLVIILAASVIISKTMTITRVAHIS